MTLRLSIENMDRLPDGGPLRVEVKARGLDIGRDAHLDWTLPDPSRYVSSKHCEIRYRDNEYWLYDVSTNGTFVNGAQFRLDAPYRLRDKDRLSIGPYIVGVAIEGGRAEPAEAASFAGAGAGGPAAADVEPARLDFDPERAAIGQPVHILNAQTKRHWALARFAHTIAAIARRRKIVRPVAARPTGSPRSATARRPAS